jgi:hypothetical protein
MLAGVDPDQRFADAMFDMRIETSVVNKAATATA